MQLHELQPKNAQATKKRIARGGKRGKTSGKGHKGQKARAGNSGVPQMRELIKKLPKLRGHGKNRARTVNTERVLPTVVNVSTLEARFDNGADISPKALVAAGIIEKSGGKLPMVKILGTGDISKKLSVTGCTLSTSAREKIEKAGGTIA